MARTNINEGDFVDYTREGLINYILHLRAAIDVYDGYLSMEEFEAYNLTLDF